MHYRNLRKLTRRVTIPQRERRIEGLARATSLVQQGISAQRSAGFTSRSGYPAFDIKSAKDFDSIVA